MSQVHNPGRRRTSSIVTGAFISLVLVGCASNPLGASSSSIPTARASIAGCVPECLPLQGTEAPREIPAGPYATRFFFGGALKISFDGGWTELDDATNELVFEHRSSPHWLLFVWIDPYPIANHTRVEGIERTPEAFISWMQTNPALIATPGPSATIGDAIPAMTVDLEVPSSAIKDEPDCPVICTNYLGFENGPDAHGLLVGEKTRIYFAPVSYGGQEHLLVVSVEVLDKARFAAVLTDAQQIIDSFRLPVDPA